MPDGSLKLVERIGRSKEASKRRLKEALAQLADEIKDGEISPDTRMLKIAWLWFDELQREAKLAGRSVNTVRIYRSTLTNWVLPAVRELQARELRVTICDRLIKKAHETKSYDTAKTVPAVLSGVCGYAVRHGAMGSNPVGSVGRLARGSQKEVLALTLKQRIELLAKLEEFGTKKQTDSCGRSLGSRGQVWLALPDIVRCMLATGARLGEVLALSGNEIDTVQRTVAVDYHLVRVKGQGLIRVPNRKGNAGGLILRVPDWSVQTFRQRQLIAGEGPLFAAWNGGWLDPSNVINRLSEAMEAVGYGWVTSHVFRKTVATVLDEADLPTSAIADQLGNTQKVTDKHYRRRRVANEATATALETMVEEGPAA